MLLLRRQHNLLAAGVKAPSFQGDGFSATLWLRSRQRDRPFHGCSPGNGILIANGSIPATGITIKPSSNAKLATGLGGSMGRCCA